MLEINVSGYPWIVCGYSQLLSYQTDSKYGVLRATMTSLPEAFTQCAIALNVRGITYVRQK